MRRSVAVNMCINCSFFYIILHVTVKRRNYRYFPLLTKAKFLIKVGKCHSFSSQSCSPNKSRPTYVMLGVDNQLKYYSTNRKVGVFERYYMH